MEGETILDLLSLSPSLSLLETLHPFVQDWVVLWGTQRARLYGVYTKARRQRRISGSKGEGVPSNRSRYRALLRVASMGEYTNDSSTSRTVMSCAWGQRNHRHNTSSSGKYWGWVWLRRDAAGNSMRGWGSSTRREAHLLHHASIRQHDLPRGGGHRLLDTNTRLELKGAGAGRV